LVYNLAIAQVRTTTVRKDYVMKRHLILVVAIGLIPLLAACGVTPLQTAEPPTAAAPTEQVVDTPTAVAEVPTATSVATATSASDPSPAPEEETADTGEEQAGAFPTPHPNPECVVAPIPEDPNIAAPTADEWSKGPVDAPLTLIEYSDFQ
jgi:hypothetical protein